jgi:hypothetical protein
MENESQGRLVTKSFLRGSNANDSAGVLTLEKFGNGGLDDIYISSGGPAKRHDETTVTEAVTFISCWIWDLNRLASFDDMVALDRDGIDITQEDMPRCWRAARPPG